MTRSRRRCLVFVFFLWLTRSVQASPEQLILVTTSPYPVDSKAREERGTLGERSSAKCSARLTSPRSASKQVSKALMLR